MTTSEATIRDDEAGTMTLAPYQGEGGGYALWHRGVMVWRSACDVPRGDMKQIKWRDFSHQGLADLTGYHPFGEYRITQDNGCARPFILRPYTDDGSNYSSIEAAKTSAEADFAKKIGACFLPTLPTSEKTDAE